MNTDVINWLKLWSSLVRESNYEASMPLFDDDFFGFGTVALRTMGKTELLENQWRHVWGRTTEFDFTYDSVVITTLQRAFLVGALWTSQGIDAKTLEKFNRAGRATIVLKCVGDTLKCIHTHFSVNPVTERFL
jgi:ketosteroid isomerase-like protein